MVRNIVIGIVGGAVAGIVTIAVMGEVNLIAIAVVACFTAFILSRVVR